MIFIGIAEWDSSHWRTEMGKCRCLGRAGWDGGQGELPFAVRAVELPAALPRDG